MHKNTNKFTLLHDIFQTCRKHDLSKKYQAKITAYDMSHLSVSQICQICIYYISHNDNILYPLEQIDNFNWIDEESLQKTNARLSNILNGKKYQYNVMCNYLYTLDNNMTINLRGRIDYVDENKIVMIKYTTNLSLDFYIELLLYKYIYQKQYENEPSKKTYLYNVITNETKEIICDLTIIENIIQFIYDTKFTTKPKLDDDEFIIQCLSL
jgi:hypothetical protein